MDEQQHTIDDLICDESFQNYCLGNNPADIERWEKWISQHPRNITPAEEAKAIISILNAKQGNLQEQLNQLKDSLHRYDSFKETLNKEEIPAIAERKRSIPIWKYAAGIAAAGILAVVAWQAFKPVTTDLPVANPLVLKSIRYYTTATDLRRTVVLADGSIVTLRSNTSISINGDFNVEARDVTLSGEAFFDVAHGTQPFVVHTSNADIEVLGTIFNVSAYPGQNHTETALFRGKVQVSAKENPDHKIVLVPNQKITIEQNTIAQQSHAVLPTIKPLTVNPGDHKASEIAWVRNRLVLEDEPLAEIASRLEKWYGITIVLNDNEVKQYRYSGTFESETVVKALEALQLSYPFSFRVIDNKIIISK